MVSLKRDKYFQYILIIVFLVFSLGAEAQRSRRRRMGQPADSVQVDSIRTDSVASDTVKKDKTPLEAPVDYEANDSIVFQDGYAHLYGRGKVKYQKIELTSDIITMNVDSSSVYAIGVKDSTGLERGTPIFKDGNDQYESKVMRYNFKSKKGFINNITTQQGEGYITSESTKKGADDELFMTHGRYTTCDNHEHPHFYLKLSMAKVRPKKNAVFGPAQLVVEDVPLPIAIPFGFFPFNSSYSSGFIMPSYGDETNRGFYLKDGGYYFAISDKMDLKVLGEIYTKGSWGVSAQSNYNKRYRYSGSFNASYLVTKTGEKNLPDYSVTKDFKISWSHRQDAKANPNSTFSANVNFATSSYDRRSISSLYNPSLYSSNTKTSSVSYSRTFADLGLNISSTFNITQNTKDSSLSVTLPDLDISLNRFYPLKRKKQTGGERWYEKISVQYTGQLTNSINTKDNLILKQGFKNWDKGMQHRIPISANFTLFKYINVIPSFNYTERWYTRKVMQSRDPMAANGVKLDTINGFNRVYNYNIGVAMNTKLYGFFKPWKMFGDKIQMIRHVFTPSVTISYAPDFGAERYGYWKTYQYTDSNGEVRTVEYSPFAGQSFSPPSKGKQGVIAFSVDNNVEMKIKSDKDTTGIRKVSLIDQLAANISYNTAATTRPWSDLSTNIRLKLSKSYTFTMNASFATYAYQFDKSGNVVIGDRTEWSYGRFGRFQGYSGSFSYTFDNNTWKKWFGKDDEKKKLKDRKDQDSEDEYDKEREEPEDEQKPTTRKQEDAKIDSDGYLKFSMPWSLSLSYSYSIHEDRTKKINIKNMRYPYSVTHSLNASGNVKLGSRWNINYSTGYDFNEKEMSMTTVNISRDLHCFSMSCGMVFGRYTSYNFSIRANASMLTDALKWDQRSNTGSTVHWY
ncbi:MAG: putative LPS assembly protein LptD [Phocaeicola sp.]|uniref:putative LPS assembly protein LptD n=1 Tax=Phocaeicola sp. TaxID=2773926 RepID=UPI003F9FB15F